MNKYLKKGIWILCAILIILQTAFAAFYMVPQQEGLRYLADAVKVSETGKILLSSPVLSLWGLLSRLLHIRAYTFLLHVLPFIIIPLCYAAYIFLVLSLPVASERKPAVLLFICLLQLFGYQSETLVPVTLLLGWYTGYALLTHLFLPLLLAFLIRYLKKHPVGETAGDNIPYEEDEDMKHKYLNSRNLGIALLMVLLLFTAVTFILNRKINNLHLATQNLQRSIEGKGEMVEFRGALGDEGKGYILVGGDGGISVLFGGDEADGPALYEEIAKYGQNVDNWYLKEGEQGAYEYCRQQGVSVSHVYVMQGMEEVQ